MSNVPLWAVVLVGSWSFISPIVMWYLSGRRIQTAKEVIDSRTQDIASDGRRVDSIEKYADSVQKYADLYVKYEVLLAKSGVQDEQMAVMQKEIEKLQKIDEECKDIAGENTRVKAALHQQNDELDILKAELLVACMGQAAAETGFRVAQKIIQEMGPVQIALLKEEMDVARQRVDNNTKGIEQLRRFQKTHRKENPSNE